MKDEDLWLDFLLAMHYRATQNVDGWDSWQEAAREFYGEQYTAIYDEYVENRRKT